MNLLNNRFLLLTFSFAVSIIFVECDEVFRRKLSYDVNLTCVSKTHPNPEATLNLVHVIAEGSNDTIHYVLTTFGFPTVIVARTAHNVSLKFDCDGLQNFTEGSLHFSEEPSYSVALVLYELMQFKDDDDTADINHGSNFTYYDVRDFSWSNISSNLKASKDMISVSSKGNSTDDIFAVGGSLELKFSVSAIESTAAEYPHLKFTGNTTEISLTLLNLNVRNQKSRFCTGLSVFSKSHFEQEKWKVEDDRSIDDEYSPGVFMVKKVLSPCPVNMEDCQGFVSWKPVAYIGAPSVANSSDATITRFRKDSIYPKSVATSFFGNESLAVASWTITFGTSGDGFYMASNYTIWSVMMGLGHPHTDSLSSVALIVIIVGLGAPLLMFSLGICYMGYKRCRRQNDDLLLEG